MKTSILATLCYSDIFDFPLKKEEIWRYLINLSQKSKDFGELSRAVKSQKYNSKFKISNSKSEFEQGLNQLLKEKKVGRLENSYFLPGREEIVELRKQREKFSQEKMKIARKAIAVLRFTPFIQMIAISGALAINNVQENDDIDFFIITKKSTLWITRLLVVLLLVIFGLYRQPEKIKNKICPNMYLTDDNLEIDEKDRGIFVAHEIVQIKPLFQRANTHQVFLQTNTWILDYLPHVFLGAFPKNNQNNFDQYGTLVYHTGLGDRLLSGFLRLLDLFLMKAQIFYMRSRRTSEVIQRNIIRFHPEDVRQKVEREYGKKVKVLDS